MLVNNIQEYYDLLAVSAMDDTFPSYYPPSLRCFYRHPVMSHKKCAIGIIIEDTEYTPNMENLSYSTLSYKFKIPTVNVFRMSLLINIQNIHDSIAATTWNSNTFIERINTLPEFANCHKIVGNLTK